jgi:SPP1 gp7 family putative phage head morphogenesis protein
MADSPSDLQRETDAFRSRLIRMDRQASAVMSATYADVLGQLEGRITALDAAITARIDAGEPVSQAWLFQQDRYQTLIRETREQMARFGETTETVTTAAQRAAVQASLVEAGRELATVSGGAGTARFAAAWASIPDATIERMVGALQASTPLGQIFQSFGPDAVQDVNRALVRGIALGLGGRDAARDVRLALGISRTRAETIVRTEVMRAARLSTASAFEASGVVKELRWTAALSDRTCSFCLSQHGRTFPLGTIMGTHQNCRCVWGPVLGNGLDPEIESGESWFDAQPASTQRSVLGNAAYEAYRTGEVQLADFRSESVDPQWGPTGTTASLAEALRRANRR